MTTEQTKAITEEVEALYNATSELGETFSSETISKIIEVAHLDIMSRHEVSEQELAQLEQHIYDTDCFL